MVDRAFNTGSSPQMNISQEEERKNKAETEILQLSCIAMGNAISHHYHPNTCFHTHTYSLSLFCTCT